MSAKFTQTAVMVHLTRVNTGLKDDAAAADPAADLHLLLYANHHLQEEKALELITDTFPTNFIYYKKYPYTANI